MDELPHELNQLIGSYLFDCRKIKIILLIRNTSKFMG